MALPNQITHHHHLHVLVCVCGYTDYIGSSQLQCHPRQEALASRLFIVSCRVFMLRLVGYRPLRYENPRPDVTLSSSSGPSRPRGPLFLYFTQPTNALGVSTLFTTPISAWHLLPHVRYPSTIL